MKFRKKIRIYPAFDRRDPNPHKDYGIHGCNMIFILIGDKGAVTFTLFTNWHLPHVVQEFDNKTDNFMCRPIPADIGYHSPHVMHEGQEPREKVCEHIGVHCYNDGSSSYADEFYQELVAKGSKGLWKKMKEYYKTIFEKE